jgi:hypothetical protein
MYFLQLNPSHNKKLKSNIVFYRRLFLIFVKYAIIKCKTSHELGYKSKDEVLIQTKCLRRMSMVVYTKMPNSLTTG